MVVQPAQGSSRRGFLQSSTRLGLVMARGSILLPDLRWLPEILAAQDGSAVVPGSLPDLLETAPTALFWVSTATHPADCRACHEQDDLAAGHVHEEAALRCRPGIRTALVSCGFMNEAPLATMCEALDAIKIDLKGFSPKSYHNVCGSELKPVLRSIRRVVIERRGFSVTSRHLEGDRCAFCGAGIKGVWNN